MFSYALSSCHKPHDAVLTSHNRRGRKARWPDGSSWPPSKSMEKSRLPPLRNLRFAGKTSTATTWFKLVVLRQVRVVWYPNGRNKEGSEPNAVEAMLVVAMTSMWWERRRSLWENINNSKEIYRPFFPSLESLKWWAVTPSTTLGGVGIAYLYKYHQPRIRFTPQRKSLMGLFMWV